MVNYTCPTCNKQFNRKSNYDYHIENKKKPCRPKNPIEPMLNPGEPDLNPKNNGHSCGYCGFEFSTNSHMNRHIKQGRCKVKNSLDKEAENNSEQTKKIDELYKMIEELKQKPTNITINNNTDNSIKKNLEKINNNIQKLEEVIPTTDKKINNQLINMIIDKDKQIDKLVNNKKEDNNVKNKIVIIDDEKQIQSDKPIDLIINNEIIVYREPDKYINATQLCKAGGKNFSAWFRLDSTKELINELGKNIYKSNAGIPVLKKSNIESDVQKNISKSNVQNNTLEKSNTNSDVQNHTSLNSTQKNIIKLIDIKKGNSSNFEQGTWIHPDLAIQLAQWISPQFALLVSGWIRTLFTSGKVEANIELLKNKDKRIKVLENLTLQKQKRTDYPESNVIYLLTTNDNKKKRIYIVGKAEVLKERLSTLPLQGLKTLNVFK